MEMEMEPFSDLYTLEPVSILLISGAVVVACLDNLNRDSTIFSWQVNTKVWLKFDPNLLSVNHLWIRDWGVHNTTKLPWSNPEWNKRNKKNNSGFENSLF